MSVGYPVAYRPTARPPSPRPAYSPGVSPQGFPSWFPKPVNDNDFGGRRPPWFPKVGAPEVPSKFRTVLPVPGLGAFHGWGTSGMLLQWAADGLRDAIAYNIITGPNGWSHRTNCGPDGSPFYLGDFFCGARTSTVGGYAPYGSSHFMTPGDAVFTLQPGWVWIGLQQVGQTASCWVWLGPSGQVKPPYLTFPVPLADVPLALVANPYAYPGEVGNHSPPDAGVPGDPEAPAPARTPPKNTEDKKVRAVGKGGYAAAIQAFHHGVTEGLDFINAVWKALPRRYRTSPKCGTPGTARAWGSGFSGGRPQSGGCYVTPQQKVRDIAKNWAHINAKKAVVNIANNEVGDRFTGRQYAAAQKWASKHGWKTTGAFTGGSNPLPAPVIHGDGSVSWDPFGAGDVLAH